MEIRKIKELVRDWFATLSIDEITSNEKLIDLFAIIEGHLLALEARL
ncbi:MAG: hypothetical protein H6626_05290 [Pseudobdellovibrionaceae bacterium]|nr:MAG: hypothetical protein H6626_05290 [Pseudobdellovibrionaceae bacterium]